MFHYLIMLNIKTNFKFNQGLYTLITFLKIFTGHSSIFFLIHFRMILCSSKNKTSLYFLLRTCETFCNILEKIAYFLILKYQNIVFLKIHYTFFYEIYRDFSIPTNISFGHLFILFVLNGIVHYIFSSMFCIR